MSFYSLNRSFFPLIDDFVQTHTHVAFLCWQEGEVPGHERRHKGRVPDHAAASRVGRNVMQACAKVSLKIRRIEKLARNTAGVQPLALELLLGRLSDELSCLVVDS